MYADYHSIDSLTTKEVKSLCTNMNHDNNLYAVATPAINQGILACSEKVKNIDELEMRARAISLINNINILREYLMPKGSYFDSILYF